MLSSTSNIKRALRAELRERRRTRTSTERQSDTTAFTANLVSLVGSTGAKRVACYLSGQNEPNTRPFLNWALANDVEVLLPISREDGLLDWAHGDGETETEGPHGMPEVVGEPLGPIAINDVDLVIIPAAAIDRGGMRMGWGRGYFDKTLGSMQKCPPVYAVIYDDELLDSVPREVHDQPVNGVVTPSRILTF
ncbi:5-formyltetrahydrofolate cyclo-ligase [Subtercola endophyticus]|uniref:5-formyltetrahydrofolate cyclo-ligase n=1 Tax=Subtercola endophyticus TaxID=2895559 RepID=UPI001E395E71|nr:5-formyltetrahydrofolate cyclo-ligase [Subtercola endophyticus]UFS59649.1 5-formyltetrahydrofolate cyclo-ligase [Subtercola endophyticus]